MTAGLGRVLAALAVAAPIVAVTAYLFVVSVAEQAGASVLGAPAPANLAEAVRFARADLAIRFLEEGQDPRQVQPLRPEVISSTVQRATALEAAAWSGEVSIVRLLERRGFLRDAHERRAAACLAADVGNEELADYLVPAAQLECVPGETARAVAARTPREEER